MYKIAVIEDDALLKQALMQMLLENGYEVFGAGSLLEARRMLHRYAMDLLLIDRWLPDGDGADLCWHMERRGKVPVIFLTARDEEADIVEAFNLGADDYLVKPVALPVLLKHLEAVLRRNVGGTSEQFSYQDFFLDYGKKELRIGERPVKLTPKEYRILEILTKNQRKVITKRMLLEQVWDNEGDFVEENTLHVTLNRLRKKIEPDVSHPIYIRNVFGLGYTFGETEC